MGRSFHVPFRHRSIFSAKFGRQYKARQGGLPMTIPEHRAILGEVLTLTYLASLLMYLRDCVYSKVRKVVIARCKQPLYFPEFQFLTPPAILITLTCNVVFVVVEPRDLNHKLCAPIGELSIQQWQRRRRLSTEIVYHPITCLWMSPYGGNCLRHFFRLLIAITGLRFGWNRAWLKRRERI